MQPPVPNSLLRSDLDGKGLLPQVTQASHSELSEADQYRGGQGGAKRVFDLLIDFGALPQMEWVDYRNPL
ncbi:hypothetical protein [Thiolapillus sp.]|uniref:hypothetical protein n=1 Tax=Thiolapillus sp. TaxID=2017437 RepID=UPI003AF7B3C2